MEMRKCKIHIHYKIIFLLRPICFSMYTTLSSSFPNYLSGGLFSYYASTQFEDTHLRSLSQMARSKSPLVIVCSQSVSPS